MAVSCTDAQIFRYCLHLSQVLNAHTKQDENFTVCFILTNTITFKHITEAQLCVSCPKIGHLDKTRTATRWDIWGCAAQIHKYSVIVYIWVKFAMHTLSKMKTFTVCSILTNTITLSTLQKAQLCMSCPKMAGPS